MRTFIATLFAASLAAGTAFAAEADGTVQKVDPAEMTIQLDDGQTYKLPPEMDITAVEEGVEVVIAYDEGDDGVNQITDMFFP